MKKALTNKEIANSFMWRVAKALKPKWMPGSVRMKFVEELKLLLDSMEWTAALRYAAHMTDLNSIKFYMSRVAKDRASRPVVTVAYRVARTDKKPPKRKTKK